VNMMDLLRGPRIRTIRPSIGLRVALGLAMSLAIIASSATAASASRSHHFLVARQPPSRRARSAVHRPTTATGSTFTISSRGETVTIDVSSTTNTSNRVYQRQR